MYMSLYKCIHVWTQHDANVHARTCPLCTSALQPVHVHPELCTHAHSRSHTFLYDGDQGQLFPACSRREFPCLQAVGSGRGNPALTETTASLGLMKNVTCALALLLIIFM